MQRYVALLFVLRANLNVFEIRFVSLDCLQKVTCNVKGTHLQRIEIYDFYNTIPPST